MTSPLHLTEVIKDRQNNMTLQWEPKTKNVSNGCTPSILSSHIVMICPITLCNYVTSATSISNMTHIEWKHINCSLEL